ncbi:MAG: hypothetical protein DHS20C15_30710 [Planctomycetota bacterium]|nr:MAG: hypothetical protein DHS20C15_30710 [Planctomycetota bacterium]
MTSRGMWVGVCAVALALGVGGWWLSDAAPPSAPESSHAEPQSVGAPDVEAEQADTTVAQAPDDDAQPEPLSLATPAAAAPAEAPVANDADPAPLFESVLGARLAGQVLTLDGAPLPDAQVVLRLGNELRDGRWRGPPTPVGSHALDTTGGFEVSELPGGDFRLTAELDGWVCVQRIEGEIVRYEEVDGAELLMAPALSVPGFVRDASSAPVEGAELVLVPRDHGPSMTGNDVLAPKLTYVGPRKVDARSDASGAFTFAPVAARSHNLSVRHAEHPTLTRVEEIDGRALHVQLEGGVTLAGIVYGANGDPLAGVSVRLRSSGYMGSSGIEPRETTTHDDGSFRLSGLTPTDNAYVMLLAPGHAVHVVQPQPLDADGTTVVEYDLAAERVIAGVVRDSAGAPIEGLSVMLQGERIVQLNARIHPVPTWEQRSGIESTTTNAEGAFRLGQLYEGTFQLALSRDHELLSVHSVESGSDDLELELDLASFGTVHFTGRVSDAISGLPVPRFELHVWRPNLSGSFSGSPHEFEHIEGRYEVRALNPGVMYVSARAEGYLGSSSAKLEYEAGEHVIGLALTPHRDLQLRVLHPDGEPVPEAWLSVEDMHGQPIWVPSGAGSRSSSLRTDAQGNAHLFELPAARVTIKLTEEWGNLTQDVEFDLTHPLEDVQTIFLDENVTSKPTRRDVMLMLVVLADNRPDDLIGTKREDLLALQTELMPRFVAGEITPLARSIELTFRSASGDVVDHASYGQNEEGKWVRAGGMGGSWATSEMPGGVSWDVPTGAGTLTLDIEGKGERVVPLPGGSDEVQAMLFFAEP